MLFAPLSLTLVATVCVSPDVVELKDGSRLIGELRVPDAGRKDVVRLATNLGTFDLARDDVARVERRGEFAERVRALAVAAAGRPYAELALAGWCLEHGLFAEAFDAVDRARAAGGDTSDRAPFATRLQSEALLDDASPLAPPKSDGQRERLLARLQGQSRSRAEFARELFSSDASVEMTKWLLVRLADSDPKQRAAAADLLGDRRDDRVLSQLLRASLIDSKEEVRAQARAATLRSNHPALVVAYAKALEAPDEAFRMRAYPALAELRDARSVTALVAMFEPRKADPVAAGAGGNSGGSTPARAHIFVGEQRAYVRDFDVSIAQGAVIAKPVIGILQSGTLLDVAVAGVFVIRSEERRAVVAALGRLTGQKFGDDPVAWNRWWEQQGGVLPPVAAAERSPATPARS